MNSTYVIGFLVSDISNAHFMSVARAIEDRISDAGYNLIVCSTDGLKDREYDYLKVLTSNKTDGLIINTTGHNDNEIARYSEYVPIVLLHRRVVGGDFVGDFVDSDNTAGAYTLTGYLVEHGHQRIAAISGPEKLSTGRERLEGYCSALMDAGIGVEKSLVYRGDFLRQSGYDGTRYLMALRDPPTAVFTMNNAMTLGALRFLRENNISVPERVSIVAYGDLDNRALLYVQPTLVSHKPRHLGEKAAELILERIANRNAPNREIVLQPNLVEGSSVRRMV